MSSNQTSLDYIFHPRSVAVAGVSQERDNVGRDFLSALIEFSFPGPVYAVNPRGGQVFGRDIYRSMVEVPGPVDYVISCVPARATESLIAECVSTGVKVVHLFTAGFREMDEKGAETEARVAEIARRGNVRIIGPNCMGIYAPASGLSFAASLPKESGKIAFLSQSGGNASQAIRLGNNRALLFSKVVSYGNALDLDETDFLEYLAKDPETAIIGAYIEGVKDGRRFLKVLGDAARAKPVVILKGGRGKAGARAIASHTGSLSSGAAVWDTVFRQTGAIRAQSVEDLVEIVYVLNSYPPKLGRRVGILGFSGGAGVLAVDACEDAGLMVPVLDSETQEKLKRFAFFSSTAGSFFSNPVDTPFVVMEKSILLQIINIIAGSPSIDWILGILRPGVGSDVNTRGSALKRMADAFIEYRQTGLKPVMLVIDPQAAEGYPTTVAEIRGDAFKAGILVSTTFSSLTQAVVKALDYREST